MSRVFQLSDLVSRCKKQADKEGDEQISDGEWQERISTVYAELKAVVDKAGLRHSETAETVTSTGVTAYSLPADHYGTLSVEWLVSGTLTGRRKPLQEIAQREEAMWIGYGTGTAQVYTIADGELRLFPIPTTGTKYLHTYIPQAEDLSSSDPDTNVDLFTPDGEAFLIWGVTVGALHKEGTDTREAQRYRDEARERIEEDALMKSFGRQRRRLVEDEWWLGGGGFDPGDYR